MTKIDTCTKTVERLLENVTPGPWSEHDAGKHPYVFVCGPDQLYYNGEVTDKPLVAYVTGVEAIQNRAFIAAARDLVPALLKERDEARAAIAASQTADLAINAGCLCTWPSCAHTAKGQCQTATHTLAASQPADPVANAGCCQSVKVKPLVWRNSYGVLRAETLFGDYKITRHILKLLSGSEQVHDDTEAAKDAAQVDYESRIISALEAAPHVNETPKIEHDRADVLTAIEPAPVTLAGALQVPEVRVLVEALRTLLIAADGESYANYFGAIETATAALRAIREGEA